MFGSFDITAKVLTEVENIAAEHYLKKTDKGKIFNNWTERWESVDEVVATFTTWFKEFWIDLQPEGISQEELDKLEGQELRDEIQRALDYYNSH